MGKIHRIHRKLTSADAARLVLMLCVLFVFCVFLLGPLAMLLSKAFQNRDGAFVGFAQFQKYLTSANMVSSLRHTLLISAVSTLISVSAAFFMAYALTRRNVPGRGFFQLVARLPMFAPTMLLGMSLIYLFGNKGILTGLGAAVPLYGKTGIILAEAIYGFPVALMILTVAFSAADNRLYEAAEVLGTGPLRQMLTITLPGVKYGLVNALFVCFTYSFTDFGAPSVVGGNYNVLATDIYKQVIGQQNFNMGAVVGIVMMLPTAVSFAVDRVTSRRLSGTISSRAVPYRVRPNRRADRLATAFCTVIALCMIAFFGVSLLGSLVTFWPYDLRLTLSNYNFTSVGTGSGAAAVWRSVRASACAAVIGTVIAFLAAYLVEKVSVFPGLRRTLYFFSIAPNAIPGTVIGLAYILFFNPRLFPIPGTAYALENSFSSLYNTVAILVCVNIIHYFSVPFITASTALKRLDREFEVVSDSLKVPFDRTLLQITVPLSCQAILEMAVYFFMNSMVTVSAVVFLCTSSTQLASVVVLDVQGAGKDAQAAALCMVLLAVNIAVRLLYELLRHALAGRTEAWAKR